MSTVIISALLIMVVVLCIRNIRHQDSCGKGCGGCSKNCSHHSSFYEAYKKEQHKV